MSTNTTFSLRRDLPTLITAKARGYFDYSEVKVFGNHEGTYNINMTVYDNLLYDIKNSSSNPPLSNFEATTLPDYSYAEEELKVLMPYDNDKTYYDLTYNVFDAYFDLYGATVSEDKILFGFNTTNYAQLNKAFPALSSSNTMEIIFKITTGDSVTSHHNCLFGRNDSNNKSLIIRSTGVFCYYTGSWTVGKTTLSPNTTYWISCVKSGTTFMGYLLADNGEYTLDTLPEYSEWSEEWTSTTDIFSNTIFNFGYNKNSTGEFFAGSFDLNECYIGVNDMLFWRYGMGGMMVIPKAKGMLYNYIDTGSAVTLNCFRYNDTFVLSSDENITDGVYLGQVEIPAHDLYDYSQTPYTVYDNFTIVGAPTLDQETGKVSGFGSSKYLNTNYAPTLNKGTPWKMRVRFKLTSLGYTQHIFSPQKYTDGPYLAINTSNKVDSGISANGSLVGSVNSTFTLVADSNYIFEWSYDGDKTYTFRSQKEGEDWQEVGTVETEQNIKYLTPLQLGANNNGYLRGIIDLSTDTWFEIDGVRTWIPTTVHYTGHWSEK